MKNKEQEQELVDLIKNQFEGFDIIFIDYNLHNYIMDSWKSFQVKVELKTHITNFDKDLILSRMNDFCEIEIKHKFSIITLQKYTEVSFHIEKTKLKSLIRENKLNYY